MWSAASLLLAAAVSAGGQAPGARQSADLCPSFRRSEGGMWCSTGPVTFSGVAGGMVTLSAGVCVKPGSPLNGRDIAEELEKQCR